jgi:hypothetical protein
MTGSTAGLIAISIVMMIILAASIYLVFYYDTQPPGQREASSERPMPEPAARQTAERPEEHPDLEHGETPAERAAGSASGRATAA